MALFKTASRLTKALATLPNLRSQVDSLKVRIEEININQGMILSAINESRNIRLLQDYEFKIFSQWGEDGIIQHLVKIIEISNKTFIEFGVEDFSESNCRFLMMKDNWSGFVIDSSPHRVKCLKDSYYYWKYDLNAVDSFVTKDNINELLDLSGFHPDLGILSIDIDGNDYYVLEAIMRYRPRIMICEYNAVFGSSRKISVPYEADFQRTRKHSSNLYFGASLGAIADLAARKGYALVGTNSAGGNAFFVRNDVLNERIEAVTAKQAYTPSKFRESRDEAGSLTYLRGEERVNAIAGMPVFNVETGLMEVL